MQAQQNPFDLFGDAHQQAELLLTETEFELNGDDVEEIDFDTLFIEPPAKVKSIQPGVYYDLSNHAYHTGPGVSKSSLGYIEKNPSQLIWNQSAPRDNSKETALDFGTAVHTLLLEPHLFDQQFVVGPDHARRSNAEKEAWAKFEKENVDRKIITADDRRTLDIMVESVYAHPVARAIFEAKGYNEASMYWVDEETQELCRIRPDRVIDWHGKPVIVDVKKVDGLDRFERNVEDFRYHVQDAMYTEGFEKVMGVRPEFWFLCVSKTASAGKYEVEVVKLPEDWQYAGHQIFRSNLNEYSRCRRENDWLHVRELIRPRWA